MKVESKTYDNKRIISRKRGFLILIFIVLITILVLILYKQFFKQAETYTVMNGSVEKATDSQGIIIKEENVVELINSSSVITLKEQGKRVRKTESIAMYKDNNYQEYVQNLDQLDKQIETLIKDLPETYSNDISYIDTQIETLSKQARENTSYIKMQEYKNKIDELTNEKIMLLGELSPDGSKVRELIDKRTQLAQSYKTASNNIKAQVAGCVTYKIDGLEGTSDLNSILKYSNKDFENLFNKYKGNISNDFGIKIINNFLAYIVVKCSDNEYIKENNSYSIKLTDNVEFNDTAELIKRVKADDGQIYCIFKIKNSIEKLIDSRIENFEIIWTKKEGMTIPLKAISLKENSTIGFVTVLKNADYISVPVKIVLSNENIAVVSNLTDEEKQENNIQSNEILNTYDQIIIKE